MMPSVTALRSRRRPPLSPLSFGLALLLAAPVAAQAGTPESPHTPATAAPATPRIALLGASLTHGLELAEEAKSMGVEAMLMSVPPARKSSIGVAALLNKFVSPPPTNHSDLYLFSDAPAKARPQVQAVLDAKPELVIGIDFLFWFGYWPKVQPPPKDDSVSDLLQDYGSNDREIDKALRSLEKQQLGFQLVDRMLAGTEALIVVGDYPDMFGAHPLMLNARHIPLRATLDELNRRLHAFAAERPRVLVFPLADYVTRVKQGKQSLPDGSGRFVTPEHAIQFDNLHPTRLGSVLVVHELWELLTTKAGKDCERLLGPRPTFAALVQHAGATADLEAVGKAATVPK